MKNQALQKNKCVREVTYISHTQLLEIKPSFPRCLALWRCFSFTQYALARYMTEARFEGLAQGGQFRIGVDSVTQESRVYKTGRIQMDDTSVTLKFRDTIGFGARDMASKTILKDTFLDVVGDFDKVRGCVLVHKCERYREGGAQDIKQIKQMLDTMGLHIGKHLLIVITHTGHLSEETQEEYTADIRKKVLEDIPEDRVIHVNFANLSELNDHHR